MRSGSPVELVLLVPGLLGPAAAGSGDPEAARALVAGLDLDALDRLLARAEHVPDVDVDADADDSPEALAFRAFGHSAPVSGTDWPVAAVTALVDHEAAKGGRKRGGGGGAARRAGAAGPVAAVTALVDHEAANGSRIRLRADPVHLRADIADLVLFDAADIDVSPDEAEALARTVNDALAPDGPRIDAAHPHRWYVAPDAPARIATTPLSRAAGTPVSDALPRGPDATRWHRWMNEVQMALHECPVNVERERRGAAPVNSVWVWGAGSLPPAGGAPAPFVQVWTDDALLRGLARHAGVERGATPAGAEEWLGGGPRPGVHLAVFDDLYPAVRRADIDAWRDGLARLSRSWAQPLLDALNRGGVSRVVIHDERGNRFAATRGGRFRWWRRAGLAARIAGARGPNS